MNFLRITLIVLLGSFSTYYVGYASNLQIKREKEIFTQATSKDTAIKAVIFDCDGTLIDNGIGYFLEWQHAMRCQAHELDIHKFYDFMNKNNLAGKPGAEYVIVNYCCELLGRSCANEILKDKREFSTKLYQTYEFPPIEETVNFLHLLEKKKIVLVLK